MNHTPASKGIIFQTASKTSGYRGIHDVYIYDVKSLGGVRWNGLRVELQYRTYVQHAWATAVEISDIVNRTRLKYGQAQEGITKFFVMCSEILARAHEDMKGILDDWETNRLLREYSNLENTLRVVAGLRQLTSSGFQNFVRQSKLFILINFTSGSQKGRFTAESFPDNASAVARYSELERTLGLEADIVLVGASQQDAIKLAYTNYFSDASEFLSALETGIGILTSR